jgi:hypothetical protein
MTTAVRARPKMIGPKIEDALLILLLENSFIVFPHSVFVFLLQD